MLINLVNCNGYISCKRNTKTRKRIIRNLQCMDLHGTKYFLVINDFSLKYTTNM